MTTLSPGQKQKNADISENLSLIPLPFQSFPCKDAPKVLPLWLPEGGLSCEQSHSIMNKWILFTISLLLHLNWNIGQYNLSIDSSSLVCLRSNYCLRLNHWNYKRALSENWCLHPTSPLSLTKTLAMTRRLDDPLDALYWTVGMDSTLLFCGLVNMSLSGTMWARTTS